MIVCAFDSASHLRGKKRTYKAVKAAVLKAGRFSIFEASNTLKDCALFTRLERDPEIEVIRQGYPWVGVARRKKGKRQ